MTRFDKVLTNLLSFTDEGFRPSLVIFSPLSNLEFRDHTMESGVNIHVANKMSSKKWDANKKEINPPSVIPIHQLLFLHSFLWVYSTMYRGYL